MRNRIWLFLHALVVVIPTIAAVAHAPDVGLFGSEVPPVLPALSAKAWWNEQLQPAFQSWFEANIGFRGVMVRTDNTVQADALREKPGADVVIGSDGILYYVDDISFMGTRPRELKANFERIDALMRAVASVDRKLRARGKQMIVLISPSKTVIYPEAIPDRWRRSDGRRSDVEVHAALRSALERANIHFADGDALLSGKHGDELERIWAPSGRHWTDLGACLVLRDALVGSAARPSCAYDMRPNDRAHSPDFDLYRLQNLWRFESAAALQPILTEEAPAPGTPAAAARPRTVFAGTSFTWMLADVMRPLVDTPVAVFYNTTIYDVSTPDRRALAAVDPDSPEWTRYVLDRDLYIIEILETYAHGEHMITFLETLDRRLDPLEN